MTYEPDGKTNELAQLLFGKYSLFEVTTSNHVLGNAPPGWKPQVDEAARLKQQGQYLRSAEILTSLMLDAQTVYTELTDILFEIEACSGLVKAADQRLCGVIQNLEMAALNHLVPPYRTRLREFVAAFASEDELRQHLSKLCGNNEYQLPRSFHELKADLTDLLQDPLYAELHENLEPETETVAVVVQSDGSWLAPPTSTSTYLPDDKFDDLRSLVKEFLSDFNEALGTGLVTSSAEYPSGWEDRIRQAVELKRRGHFLASATIYVELSRSEGTVYTGTLNALYKTVAAAGDLLNANFILMRGQSIYRLNPHGPSVAAGIASNFADHLSRLVSATESPGRLEDYLRSISGNPRYYVPRDYNVMVAELRAHYAKAAQMFDDLDKMQKKSDGGCYIATAVYGSYDAPAVLTLRRFRDEVLAKNSMGRALIFAYYTVSPPLARRLVPDSKTSLVARSILERIVQRLER